MGEGAESGYTFTILGTRYKMRVKAENTRKPPFKNNSALLCTVQKEVVLDGSSPFSAPFRPNLALLSLIDKGLHDDS